MSPRLKLHVGQDYAVAMRRGETTSTASIEFGKPPNSAAAREFMRATVMAVNEYPGFLAACIKLRQAEQALEQFNQEYPNNTGRKWKMLAGAVAVARLEFNPLIFALSSPSTGEG